MGPHQVEQYIYYGSYTIKKEIMGQTFCWGNNEQNFSSVRKYMSLQFKEAEWNPSMINPKKSTPTHMVKLSKAEDKEQSESRKKKNSLCERDAS